MSSSSAFRRWFWPVGFLAAFVLYAYVAEDYDPRNPRTVHQMMGHGSEVVRAQETVRRQFPGETVEFRKSYVGYQSSHEICGEVAVGKAKERQRFISGWTTVWLERETHDFEYLWSVHCRR